MQQYDEDKNIQLLRQLPQRLRVAFSLLCATRILPRYREFHLTTGRGNADKLNLIVRKLWDDCLDQTMSGVEASHITQQCLGLVPSESEGWDERTQPYAEDAAAAVAYACRARFTGKPEEAAWAGRRVYESLDHWVQAKEAVGVLGINVELSILSHPLVQAELVRQQRDLLELKRLSEVGVRSADLSRLLEMSKHEARVVFVHKS